MATTDIQIANMALGFVGVSQTIASMSEKSKEANVCSLYYQQAVDATLEDFPWPDATAYATLGLVTDYATLPAPYDWGFAYRTPSDCVFVRRIVTVMARRDPDPPSFRTGKDEQGRLIYTNQENAVIEYTARIDAGGFSAMFAEAVAWRLAAYIAPSLSRVKGMMTTMMQVYLTMLMKAKVSAANQSQQEIEPESDFIRARD